MYNKKEALKNAKKQQKTSKEHQVIEDKDRIVNVLTRDSSLQKLDVIYEFDDKDNQIKYTVKSYCDSCAKKYLKNELESKSYKWKRLNDSTYISNFYLKWMLHIHPSEFSYEIVKHNFSRKERREMIKNAQ